MQEVFFFRLWLSLATMIPVLPVSAGTLHVWQDSPNPTPPYTNWLMAARSIQEAINTAVAGDTVLVTNGVYATGGRAMSGSLTNRVAIDKAITVQSVGGPAVTIIVGAAAPGGGNGDGAIRGAYVGTNAVLSGFTLTNGHTRFVGEYCGGGVWCETSGVVTNCVLTGNSAASYGGGAKGGTLYHCTLTNNSAATGGGAYSNILHYCSLIGNLATDGDGGGASESSLYHCTLSGNVSDDYGGGAHRCTLYQCTVVGNSAWSWGGGASGGALYNCLVSSNSAQMGGGGVFSSTVYQSTLVGNVATFGNGGGTWGGSDLYNCIVYYNASFMPVDVNYSGGTFYYSCTTPLPTGGAGNITNEPVFVNAQAGDYRLRYGSPCIDAGTNLSAFITNDLAGNPRPLAGNGDGAAAFDMGAYEYNPQSADSNGDGVPDWWTGRFGLDPNDPQVAAGDPDHDGHTNFEEWMADTDPTNAHSILRIEAIAVGPPVSVSFNTSSNRLYTLFYAPNISGSTSSNCAWIEVPGQTDVRGTGSREALDTQAAARRCYRIGVKLP